MGLYDELEKYRDKLSERYSLPSMADDDLVTGLRTRDMLRVVIPYSTLKNQIFTEIIGDYEVNTNKITVWGDEPTDIEYPSAKLTKDSLDAKVPYEGATVDVDLGEHNLSLNMVKFNTDYSITESENIGSFYWNTDEETMDLKLNDEVILQLGQEVLVNIKNQTGSDLTNITPVMFAGTLGASGKVLVQKAISDGSIPSSYMVGVLTEYVANGESGKATWRGKVRQVDTTGSLFGETWSDGDIIYVSPTTKGYLTNIKPSAPNRSIFVGVVINAASNGTLMVRPTWYQKISEADDVNASLSADGQILVWNNSNSYFDTNYNINDYALNSNLTTHINDTTNPHSVTKTQIGLNNVPNVDCTNASNITSGTLPSSVIPPVALTTATVVSSEAAQLALTVEEGDVAVRSDLSKSYIHNGGTSGSMSDWYELQTPTDTVLSVNGETGTVILTSDNISEGSSNLYLTGNEYQIGTNTMDNITDGATYVKTTNDYSSTEKTKLSGIEDNADVTDTANVTNAGALMDSEVNSLSGIKTLTVPDSTTISAFGATLIDATDAATARTTLGVDATKTISLIKSSTVSSSVSITTYYDEIRINHDDSGVDLSITIASGVYSPTKTFLLLIRNTTAADVTVDITSGITVEWANGGSNTFTLPTGETREVSLKCYTIDNVNNLVRGIIG